MRIVCNRHGILDALFRFRGLIGGAAVGFRFGFFLSVVGYAAMVRRVLSDPDAKGAGAVTTTRHKVRGRLTGMTRS